MYRLYKWFTKKRKRALFEALDKVKAELMILGFILLILTFTQDYIAKIIAKICISEDVSDTMLPCPVKGAKVKVDGGKEYRRRLFLYDYEGRLLVGVSKSTCKKGKYQI